MFKSFYEGITWLASRPWGFALIVLFQIFLAVIVIYQWRWVGSIVLIIIFGIWYIKGKRMLGHAYHEFDKLINGASAQDIINEIEKLTPDEKKEVILYLKDRCNNSDIHRVVLDSISVKMK